MNTNLNTVLLELYKDKKRDRIVVSPGGVKNTFNEHAAKGVIINDVIDDVWDVLEACALLETHKNVKSVADCSLVF